MHTATSCPTCHQPLQRAWQHCPHCGQPLGPISARPVPVLACPASTEKCDD